MLALLKTTAKWVGGVVLGLALIYVAINAADEPLNPEMAAILNAKPSVEPKENGFFYMMGMDAPLEQNPSEVGRVYVEHVRRAARELPFEEALKASSSSTKGKGVIRFTGTLPSCDWRRQSCLEIYGRQVQAIKKLAKDNAQLMARYTELKRFRQFEDGPDASLVTLPLEEPYKLARLDQALAAVAFQEKQTEEFLARLSAQADFDRVQLRGNNTLLTKMLGIAFLEQAARLVSEAVRADKNLAREGPALLTIVAPMDAEERQLGRVLDSETRLVSELLGQEVWGRPNATGREKLYFWLTVKPHSTENLMFDLHREWRAADPVPTTDYLATEKRILERLRRRAPEIPSLDLVYNPMGKVMVAAGAAEWWSGYYRRVIDADGLLRLVSLQIQIAEKGVQDTGIAEFLANSDSKYRDPYSGAPMQWSKARGLYFRGYSDRLPDKDGWISVKL